MEQAVEPRKRRGRRRTVRPQEPENKLLAGKDPEEAADEIRQTRRETLADVRKRAKHAVVVMGFEIVPYFSDRKKQGLVKVILKKKNEILGHVYRNLVAKNVNVEEGNKLLVMNAEKANEEYQKRRGKINFGYPLPKKKKQVA